MNRVFKLFLVVFLTGFSIAHAAFQGKAKQEGEAQAILMLSLVRQNRLPEAATQIFDLTKSQIFAKNRFDYQLFDTDYLYKKIPLPKYDDFVRVPMTPKTAPTNYVLFIIDSYLLRAAVLNDTNRYVDFLVNVVLENKESRSIIAAVLDTVMYRFPGERGEKMATDLLIKHYEAHPDSDVFWHLDPADKRILNRLPQDMQVKLLTQYLNFDHRFTVGQNYTYHYEMILMKLRSLIPVPWFVDTLSGLITANKSARDLNHLQDGALKRIVEIFIETAKTLPDGKERFTKVFDQAFLKSKIFNIMIRSNLDYFANFVAELHAIDKVLSAEAVKEFLIRNSNYLSSTEAMERLIKPYIIRFSDNVNENPYLRYIATSLDTVLGSSAQEEKHKLFEKYYKAPTPLPVNPKVHVPGVNMCLSFYKG